MRPRGGEVPDARGDAGLRTPGVCTAAPQPPPRQSALPSVAGRVTEDGGSERSPPAGQRRSVERGAGGVSAVVLEPRSPKQQPLGGRGRGRGPGGPRAAAGLEGASEEPGSGARARHPRAIAGRRRGPRGEFGRRAGWGDGERKLFNW